MPGALRGDARLAFHAHLEFEALVDGFRVTGPGGARSFTGGSQLARLGRAVHSGARTVDEVVAAEAEATDTGGAAALHLLETLHDAGVLDAGAPQP